MDLADKLKALRKQKGWSQNQAAEAMSIQQSYLSKLENGQFQPSSDVIEKICKAYNISGKRLTRRKHHYIVFHSVMVLFSLIGTLFIINGYFALVYPETYYTYKITPLSVQETSDSYIDYHMTDKYIGDRSIKNLSDTKYEYSLIATRKISRFENRYLIAGGILFLFLSLAGFILVKKSMGIKRRNLTL